MHAARAGCVEDVRGGCVAWWTRDALQRGRARLPTSPPVPLLRRASRGAIVPRQRNDGGRPSRGKKTRSWPSSRHAPRLGRSLALPAQKYAAEWNKKGSSLVIYCERSRPVVSINSGGSIARNAGLFVHENNPSFSLACGSGGCRLASGNIASDVRS